MDIVSRSTWGSQYGLGWHIRPLPARTAWLHHDVAGTPPQTVAAERVRMRALDRIGYQRFGPHTGTGWNPPFGAGISYSYVVMPSGRVYEGHGINRASSHTSGHNTDGIGICVPGNYMSNTLTAAQRESIAQLLVRLRDDGIIQQARLTGGHRDVSSTSCPGNNAYNAISAINARAAQIAAGGGSTPPPEPDPEPEEISVSEAKKILDALGPIRTQASNAARDAARAWRTATEGRNLTDALRAYIDRRTSGKFDDTTARLMAINNFTRWLPQMISLVANRVERTRHAVRDQVVPDVVRTEAKVDALTDLVAQIAEQENLDAEALLKEFAEATEKAVQDRLAGSQIVFEIPKGQGDDDEEATIAESHPIPLPETEEDDE